MIATGKCPSCGEHTQVAWRAGRSQEKFGMNQLEVITYVCSRCDAVLGVGSDPIALMADITERVAKRLGAPPKR